MLTKLIQMDRMYTSHACTLMFHHFQYDGAQKRGHKHHFTGHAAIKANASGSVEVTKGKVKYAL